MVRQLPILWFGSGCLPRVRTLTEKWLLPASWLGVRYKYAQWHD